MWSGITNKMGEADLPAAGSKVKEQTYLKKLVWKTTA